jgi:putative hemolysin
MSNAEILGVVCTIIASFFFSGVEMAYVSANKLYFELQSKQGTISGQIIATFLKQPSRFIGTMLIGNTLALVLYGILMEGYLHHQLQPLLTALPDWLQWLNSGWVVILLPSIIATILILALAEFTPKSIFLLNPDGFLEVLAIPILVVYYVMYPLVYVIVELSKWFIVHVLRLEYNETKPAFGLTDLNNYIQNMNRRVSVEEEAEVDTKIFNNAIEFRELRVRDCMIPRMDMVAINLEEGIEGLRKAFIESAHSKILVYKDDSENVIGYCHSVALFKKPKDILGIMTNIPIAPEAMLAKDLLIRLVKERKSLALVVDEFGSTSGLVSLEDVMEQIFGEIQDEFDDTDDLIERKIDEKTYVLSARHEIDYLNEKYDWQFPEGDYDTLAGMLITFNEDIPELNEVILLPPFEFTILSKTDARLETVRMEIVGEIEASTQAFTIKH